jgi:phosphopantothenoylcysteine decarboxylase/phosphopantothenate--cysteine ligase
MQEALSHKKILVAVTGSIAAYKACLLCRILMEKGAEVKVIMTPSATEFVTPLTFSTLTGNPVVYEMSADGNWNNHVSLGIWADAMVIAPATATTLSKLASGCADNIVTATYLSARCPVFICPAMDLDMWQHPSTSENIRKLTSFGNHIISPAHGKLASGLIGDGRLQEPHKIADDLALFFRHTGSLEGKKVLITAGPTIEPIDPVRYISNHSSGKMGVALARTFAAAGAEVALVIGPVHIPTNFAGVRSIHVNTADEMWAAAEKEFTDSHITICCAAVADYKPAKMAIEKIKKSDSQWSLELVKNMDIAQKLGERKSPGQILAGFALETQHGPENAAQKLATKNLDLIILNMIDEESPLGSAYNKISILDKRGKINDFPRQSKDDAAHTILDKILEFSA